MRSENPEANFGEISSLVAKAWKNLSLEEKEFYEQKSKEDREARKSNNIAEQSENNEILIPKIPNAKISPSKKLKKLNKEKPSLDDYDEDEVEKAKDEVQEKPSGTVFDQVVEESKSRKRRTDFDPEAVDEAVNSLLQRMFAAYQEDLELMKENQPATKKLLLLKDVVSMASKKIFQKPLMDNGFLSQLKNWLSPLSDGSLPSSNLRNDLYVLLQTLPTEFVDEPLNSRSKSNEHVDNISLLEYLRESEDEHGEGLGKVLMNLWRKENVQFKPMLRDIIERWARPLFGSSTDYKELIDVEADKAQKIFQRSRRL
jgi:hypothetical protein